jgi:hypothetical protein
MLDDISLKLAAERYFFALSAVNAVRREPTMSAQVSHHVFSHVLWAKCIGRVWEIMRNTHSHPQDLRQWPDRGRNHGILSILQEGQQ